MKPFYIKNKGLCVKVYIEFFHHFYCPEPLPVTTPAHKFSMSSPLRDKLRKESHDLSEWVRTMLLFCKEASEVGDKEKG